MADNRVAQFPSKDESQQSIVSFDLLNACACARPGDMEMNKALTS